jgi:arylsulfatase A-like enzyme
MVKAKEMSDHVSQVSGHFLNWVVGGLIGGIWAGLWTAFWESLFIQVTIGSYWADLEFWMKALGLHAAVGAAAGLACSALLYFFVFRRRPLARTRPWVFFLALLSAGGMAAETVLFLLDVHTFRNLRGGWTIPAYAVLLAGLLAAGFTGWAIARAGRRFFQGGPWLVGRNSGILLLIVMAILLSARAYSAWRMKVGLAPVPEKMAVAPANVIILLIDSLRADHLSSYGYPLPTSPVIDRLAREGILFRNGFATSNWTVPTHASIFTGLYPSSHGAYSLHSSLDPTVPTLARLLAAKGYRTGIFFDNPLLHSHGGLLQGFQARVGVDNAHKVSLALDRVWDRLHGRRAMSGNILRTAGKWIAHGRGTGRPFFLFVNVLDAHLPYRPQKPYIDDFLKSLPNETVNTKLTRIFTRDGIRSKKTADSLFRRLTAADWRWLGRFYDSNIRAIDDRIGEFLQRLKNEGLLDNTLVVVTADHGELLGESGLGGHYQSTFSQAALRVPLICWFPGHLPSMEIQQPVSQVDFLPSILKLTGLAGSIPPASQGGDLFAPSPGRPILAEFWDEGRQGFSRAFLLGEQKLILYASGEKEMYDVTNDPAETSNLVLDRPELLRHLTERLSLMLRSMATKKAVERLQTRKEAEKALRSLGYL